MIRSDHRHFFRFSSSPTLSIFPFSLSLSLLSHSLPPSSLPSLPSPPLSLSIRTQLLSCQLLWPISVGTFCACVFGGRGGELCVSTFISCRSDYASANRGWLVHRHTHTQTHTHTHTQTHTHRDTQTHTHTHTDTHTTQTHTHIHTHFVSDSVCPVVIQPIKASSCTQSSATQASSGIHYNTTLVWSDTERPQTHSQSVSSQVSWRRVDPDFAMAHDAAEINCDRSYVWVCHCLALCVIWLDDTSPTLYQFCFSALPFDDSLRLRWNLNNKGQIAKQAFLFKLHVKKPAEKQNW